MIRARWEAFSLICREAMEMEPETVVRAWAPPLLDHLEQHRQSWGSVELDAEEVEAYLDTQRRLWRRVLKFEGVALPA